MQKICKGFIGFVAIVFAMQHQVVMAKATPQLEITWLGGPAMVINFNGLNILTDPTFGDGQQAFIMADPNEAFDLAKGPNTRTFSRVSPFPGLGNNQIDLVLLSHAHEDHFDQVAQKQLPKATPFITPTADVEKVTKMGFTSIHAMAWGDSKTIDLGAGKVTITSINAHHTTNPELEPLLGLGNGYWMEFQQGDWQKTIYWTGDSLPTQDVIEQVTNMGALDILIPHMGRVGTTGPLGQISMGASDVMALSSALSPQKVLPIHHSTYPLYLEPIDKLVSQSQGAKFGLDLISEGSSVIYR